MPRFLYLQERRAQQRRLLHTQTFDQSGTLVPSFTVSGTVTDTAATPLADVAVSLQKDAVEIDTDTTDAQGAYEFTGVYSGSYTIVFTLATYEETTVAFTVEGADSTQDIELSGLYAISGTCYASDGVTPLDGLIFDLYRADEFGMTVGDPIEEDITSGAVVPGVFATSDWPNGTYRLNLQPGQEEYFGNPQNYFTATIADAITLVDGESASFTPATCDIIGTILLNGAAADQVPIELISNYAYPGEIVSTTMSISGTYIFSGVESQDTYTVRPVWGGATFNPPTVFVGDYTGNDLYPPTLNGASDFLVSGTITPDDAELVGEVLITLVGATYTRYAVSNIDGTWSAYCPADTYDITPTKDGYTFTPAALEDVAVAAAVPDQDFVIAAV